MFDHLFNPIALGKVLLPNRIGFLAHRTNFAQKGCVSDCHTAYYRQRAKGGCGLIIVGELCIDPDDRPWEAMIDAYDTRVIKGFQTLTGAIHEYETKVFANLNHHGFQSSGAITRKACLAPSAQSDIAFGETGKSMEAYEIRSVVMAVAQSAALAVEGGFDGIEIDMGPYSLLRQFLSSLSNHRQDEYGQSLENRMRFPLAVVHAVREQVGPDVPLGIRLCADEIFWGAITPEESCEMAKIFEATTQVDFINVAVGTYYNLHMQMASMHTPDRFALETTRRIKGSIAIPVIGGYQMASPKMADECIGKKDFDVVGFIRNLICDPKMPNKALTGDIKAIRSCVRDNNGCIGRINQSKILGCIQNPEVGFEHQKKTNHIKPDVFKTVWVVGAGPAGLEVARVASDKGHTVTLYEKNAMLGGQINLQCKAAGRKPMEEVVRYLRYRLGKRDVRVVTKTQVTKDFVNQDQPDVVVIATGSVPCEKPVDGNYDPPFVINVRDVLEEKFPVGDRVLFVDENGGHHATATVELLADQGKKIDMVTSDLFIGIGLAPIGDLYLTRQRLLQKGVTFTTNVRVIKIDGNVVHANQIHTNESIEYKDYDTVVLDMGDVADDSLYFQLKGKVNELYRIGDSVAPRGIDMAILEARRTGEII
jgi:mycofactocin system FadH/OYE family oxidoreductase 2